MNRRLFLASAFGSVVAHALPAKSMECVGLINSGWIAGGVGKLMRFNDKLFLLTQDGIFESIGIDILRHAPCGGYCEDPGWSAAIYKFKSPEGY